MAKNTFVAEVPFKIKNVFADTSYGFSLIKNGLLLVWSIFLEPRFPEMWNHPKLKISPSNWKNQKLTQLKGHK